MDQTLRTNAIPVEDTSLEEGDVLPEAVRVFYSPEPLTEIEIALCDGEGGAAASKGTKTAMRSPLEPKSPK